MALIEVPPPPYVPAAGGLLDVAAVRDDIDPHWQVGVQWDSLCAHPASATENDWWDCDTEPPDPPWPGTPTGFGSTVEWTPFLAFHRHACSPVGRTLADHEAQAVSALTRGEGRAVEAVLERGAVTADGSVGSVGTPLASNATAVTGSAGTIVDAVAALEQALGWQYGGQGVIHLSRALATLAASESVLVSAGQGRYRTALGTPVAVGSGYLGAGPSGITAGTLTAYATGPVVIYRSEVLPLGDAIVDHEVNTVEVLAARTYLVGWDCLALSADVTHTIPAPPDPEPVS